MSEKTVTVRPAFPLATVLFIVFLVLKLTGNITWSWVWVTAPLWISAGLGVLLALIAMVCFAVARR